MISPARRAARFGVAILTTLALTPLAPAAGATGAPFVVVNSASQLAGPVPRGAQLSIFTVNRISREQARTFNPWKTTKAPDGLFVEASCGAAGSMMRLPLLYVGWSGDGSRIDVYYPNSIGPEPFGTCVDFGMSQVWVYPGSGYGDPLMAEVETILSHPGIFAIGDVPKGDHVDGYSGVMTPVITCNERLPADPTTCRVRTLGEPAELLLDLTGAEAFVCDPCAGSPLIFELAPVVGGVVGTYVPQFMGRLIRKSTGVEQARIYLYADAAPGEYLLRVRNTLRPEFPPPLQVEFGQPG